MRKATPRQRRLKAVTKNMATEIEQDGAKLSTQTNTLRLQGQTVYFGTCERMEIPALPFSGGA